MSDLLVSWQLDWEDYTSSDDENDTRSSASATDTAETSAVTTSPSPSSFVACPEDMLKVNVSEEKAGRSGLQAEEGQPATERGEIGRQRDCTPNHELPVRIRRLEVNGVEQRDKINTPP